MPRSIVYNSLFPERSDGVKEFVEDRCISVVDKGNLDSAFLGKGPAGADAIFNKLIASLEAIGPASKAMPIILDDQLPSLYAPWAKIWIDDIPSAAAERQVVALVFKYSHSAYDPVTGDLAPGTEVPAIANDLADILGLLRNRTIVAIATRAVDQLRANTPEKIDEVRQYTREMIFRRYGVAGRGHAHILYQMLRMILWEYAGRQAAPEKATNILQKVFRVVIESLYAGRKTPFQAFFDRGRNL